MLKDKDMNSSTKQNQCNLLNGSGSSMLHTNFVKIRNFGFKIETSGFKKISNRKSSIQLVDSFSSSTTRGS
jgi:hypothetical protein